MANLREGHLLKIEGVTQQSVFDVNYGLNPGEKKILLIVEDD
jgi:hypothetical protein